MTRKEKTAGEKEKKKTCVEFEALGLVELLSSINVPSSDYLVLQLALA
jgi:hypothetical protein